MKVLTVVGNRPQFIKSAPLSAALRAHGIDEVVVHTGQHYDHTLSRVFFEELALAEPHHRLDLRSSGVDVMQPRISAVVVAVRPDCVIVLGDTNSTLAGARAAAAAGVPLAHVEAGLRSGDLSMPEERNRIEVDRLAAVLFSPEERSAKLLETEGVPGDVEIVGDVMYDATLAFGPIARERSTALGRFGVEPRQYVLATIHREANVRPERLRRIVDGLGRGSVLVLFAAHPRTSTALRDARIEPPPHVRLLPPLGYLDAAALASQAHAIVTDSGGLQKEAYWFGVPCVTTRPSTEWIDTVALGANVLVDDDPEALASAVSAARRLPDDRPQLYGDGHAAERVAEALARRFARKRFDGKASRTT